MSEQMFRASESRPEMNPSLEDLTKAMNPSQETGEGEVKEETFTLEDYKALELEKNQLQRKMEILANNMMSPEYINFLEQQRMGQALGRQTQFPVPAPQASLPVPEPEEKFDPDQASRQELVEYITKRVSKLLDTRISEVDTKLNKQEYESQYERAHQEVQAVMAKYPDFLTYRPAMIEIARKHPTLSAEETYVMAKARDKRFQFGAKPQAPPVAPTPPAPSQKGGERPGRFSSSSARTQEDFKSYDQAIAEVMKELNL